MAVKILGLAVFLTSGINCRICKYDESTLIQFIENMQIFSCILCDLTDAL